MTPSICGSFLSDKRSLVAFTWTLTTVLTLVAFIACTVGVIHVHTYYKRMEHIYEEEQYVNNNNNNVEGGEGEEEHGSADNYNREKYELYLALASIQSGSLTFVAMYTIALAIALSLYGSTAIVGFTSLRGVYIAPCLTSSSGSSSLKLGIFGGAIVFFANLLLVCAVIFGEIRVEDWRNYRGGDGEEENREQREDREPYEIERIATVMAVTCMFLAALYSIFAILLFLFFGSEDNVDPEEVGVVTTGKPLSSIANDPRRENFLTIGENIE